MKKKEELVCQCRFTRSHGGHTGHTIGYIPSWAAKVGNHVQLLNLGEEFWVIYEVGEPINKELVNERGYKDFQESLKGGGID